MIFDLVCIYLSKIDTYKKFHTSRMIDSTFYHAIKYTNSFKLVELIKQEKIKHKKVNLNLQECCKLYIYERFRTNINTLKLTKFFELPNKVIKNLVKLFAYYGYLYRVINYYKEYDGIFTDEEDILIAGCLLSALLKKTNNKNIHYLNDFKNFFKPLIKSDFIRKCNYVPYYDSYNNSVAYVWLSNNFVNYEPDTNHTFDRETYYPPSYYTLFKNTFADIKINILTYN